MKNSSVAADKTTPATLRREWGLVAGAALFIVGMVVLFQVVPTWSAWLQLNNRGVTASAENVSSRYVISGGGIRWYVTYRFYDQAIPYEHEQEIDETLFRAIDAGAPMMVVYLPDSPAVVHLVDTDAPSMPLTVIGGCLIGLSLLVLFYTLTVRRQTT